MQPHAYVYIETNTCPLSKSLFNASQAGCTFLSFFPVKGSKQELNLPSGFFQQNQNILEEYFVFVDVGGFL